MGVQGVCRAAAGMRGVVVCLVVLGGAVGPTSQGSAQPVRLEAGQWYRVSPATHHTVSAAATTVAASADSITRVAQGPVLPTAPMAWLAVAGCLLVLTAGLIGPARRSGTFSVRRLPNGAAVSPRGANKNV
jgi:hypothetical protein